MRSIALFVPALFFTLVLASPSAHAKGDATFGYKRKDGTEVSIARYHGRGFSIESRLESQGGKVVRKRERERKGGLVVAETHQTVSPNGTERSIRVSQGGTRILQKTSWQLGKNRVVSERLTEDGETSWNRQVQTSNPDIRRLTGTHFAETTYIGVAGSSTDLNQSAVQQQVNRTGTPAVLIGNSRVRLTPAQ